MPATKTKPRPVDANTLAWWAEEAHGKQGTPLVVFEGDDGQLVISETLPTGKEALFEVTTHGEKPDRLLPAHKIAVQVKRNGPERNLLNDPELPGADALFWTASSIEKFVFPYYHAQRLYSQRDMCTMMERYRNDKKLVAAVHRAPSKTAKIGVDESTAILRVANTPDGFEWGDLRDYLS
jgi:hypothetical protein